MDLTYYATKTELRTLKLPKVICPGCKVETEPDFIEAKTFAFPDKKIFGDKKAPVFD
jgi:hypothetical protein